MNDIFIDFIKEKDLDQLTSPCTSNLEYERVPFESNGKERYFLDVI